MHTTVAALRFGSFDSFLAGLDRNWVLLYPSGQLASLKLTTVQDFFYQVRYQTTSAYIENKHFFTKSCNPQTYQNYEQPPQSLQNLYSQSHFSASKINQIFLIFFSMKNIRLDQLYLLYYMKFFENFDFLSTLFSENVPNFCQLWS